MKKALLKLFDSHEECLIKFERANDFILKKNYYKFANYNK